MPSVKVALENQQRLAVVLVRETAYKYALGDYNKALELEERTLSMAQNLGTRKSKALALLIIGLIKRHQKKPLEGLEATRKPPFSFPARR